MAYTTINDPSKYFQVAIWTGSAADGSGSQIQAITNDGNSDMQPDWVWVKQRSNAAKHHIVDSSRGVSQRIVSDNTDAEDDQGSNNGIYQFNSDGFNVGTFGRGVNDTSKTYVGWQWKMNGGSTTSFNESGDNPGGNYQADTTAGHSIVTYTGTGAAGTVSHGLGSTPSVIIIKDRSEAGAWIVYHQIHGNAAFTKLNDAVVKANESSNFNNTDPTSSVFTVGTSTNVNKDANNYVAYCFCEKKGYSKFGVYQGNSSADGAFVNTGFRPAWIIVKASTDTKNWHIADDERISVNGKIAGIRANTNDAENTGSEYGPIDILSNGFKFRTSDNQINGDGSDGRYIYMAFAKHPLVTSTGTPTTAR